MLCKLYNKGVCRYQNKKEHKKCITYQHFYSNCLTSTGKKYEHAKLKNKKKRAQMYRRFDCGINSSKYAYMAAGIHFEHNCFSSVNASYDTVGEIKCRCDDILTTE